MKRLNNVIRYWKKQLENTSSLGSGEEVFFPKLLNIAKRSPKIIEIGIGKGRMVSILKDNSVCAEFYGIDISDNVKDSGTMGVRSDGNKLHHFFYCKNSLINFLILTWIIRIEV